MTIERWTKGSSVVRIDSNDVKSQETFRAKGYAPESEAPAADPDPPVETTNDNPFAGAESTRSASVTAFDDGED
jgi:hypothetical protein